MAALPGTTPAPPWRRPGASASVQQNGAERMEAIAAAAEEAREAREEEAANGPPKRAPGRPRKLPVFAAQQKPVPKPPPDRGASKPRGDWWRPELILPVLREVALRRSPTFPPNEDTADDKPTYREALVRQRVAYKPGDSGRRGVLVDHRTAVQQQIIQIIADLRGPRGPQGERHGHQDVLHRGHHRHAQGESAASARECRGEQSGQACSGWAGGGHGAVCGSE
jgi:hypothetical protein